MIELTPVFSIKDDIENEIITKRRERGLIDDDINLFIIGQEQDGTILYCWWSVMLGVEGSPVCTHFGTFDPSTKVKRCIYHHEKKVTVVNGSINQEQTFLGFVTVEEILATDTSEKLQKKDVYKAFLAEIQPAHKVYYLNIERTNYMKLQFLYGKYKAQQNNRESHMLVFLYKESIGLYHIPVARMGDKNVIMGGEPKKDQIFHKKFAWCQWDKINQRLFIAHFRKSVKSSSSPSGAVTAKPFLTCYQFNLDTNYEFMMEVPLDLPITYPKSSQRHEYLNLGICDTIPDAANHMQVLTLPCGSFCICFQHPVTKTQTASKVSPEEEESLVSIQYSVCMVHHGRVLNFIGPAMPFKQAQVSRIMFTWLNSYLLAYLPGCFAHLLNICIEYESCLHILWTAPYLKHSQDELEKCQGPFVPNYIVPCMRERAANTIVLGAYDCEAKLCYKVTVNMDTLCHMFECSNHPSTRLAIMHYVTTRIKELNIARKLFHIMSNGLASPEVPDLLKEFLIGSTYAAIKRQVDKSYLKFLSFTISETFRGEVEKGPDGYHLNSISYSSLKQPTFGDKKRQSERGDALWENLKKHFAHKNAWSRFNHSDVRKEVDLIKETPAEESNASPAENPSLLRKIGSMAKSAFVTQKSVSEPSQETKRPPSRSERLLGSPPPFLGKNVEPLDIRQDSKLAKEDTVEFQTLEVLAAHLCLHLKKESRSKIRNIATEYLSCQMHQTRQLCHLIWSVLGDEDASAHVQLRVRGSLEEHDLFTMLERLYLVSHELAFPTPPGFSLYFISLGFRCLSQWTFLQYVDRGVFKISPDFVYQMLEDLNDSNKQNVEIKFQVIIRMDKNDMIGCLRHWDHPIGMKYQAKMYTAACLRDEYSGAKSSTASRRSSRRSLDSSFSQSTSAAGVAFPPLDTLITHLEKKDPSLASGHNEMKIDSRFLEEASMLQKHFHSE